MIRLGIVISLIAIGKIRGQLAAVPGAINVQILPPTPLEYTVVPVQGRLISFSSQVLPQSNSVQLNSRDRSQPSDRFDGGLNLRPLTLRESQPNRKFFIPQRTPEMPGPPDKVNIELTKSNIDPDINTPANRQNNMNPEQFESPPGQHELSLKSNKTKEKPDAPVITSEAAPNVSRVNKTEEQLNATNGKLPKPSIVDKATGVEVTLDERASFDGDKCPTGYVRINGMCVEKD